MPPTAFNYGVTVQYMRRYPWAFASEQIALQTAYEVDHPAADRDFGDRGILRSCYPLDTVGLEMRERYPIDEQQLRRDTDAFLREHPFVPVV